MIKVMVGRDEVEKLSLSRNSFSWYHFFFIVVEIAAWLMTLTLSQLMLHICNVSKVFGEWYQKTNETEDTYKLT
jgi:hypothetical protein